MASSHSLFASCYQLFCSAFIRPRASGPRLSVIRQVPSMSQWPSILWTNPAPTLFLTHDDTDADRCIGQLLPQHINCRDFLTSSGHDGVLKVDIEKL